MKLVIVGSGTLLPDPVRGSPAHWIQEGDVHLLLDCGAGTLRTMARLRLPWEGISHLLLSHFHTDHVGELAPLLFALKHGPAQARSAPLRILGPPGLQDHLRHLSRAHGSFVLDPGFPVLVEELDPGAPVIMGEEKEGDMEGTPGPLTLLTRTTRHTESSLAFRLEGASGAIGYTGDTGPAPELEAFFRGCRVLVAECSHPDSMATENHLSPSSLAQVAGGASPELLVTVHGYPPLESSAIPDLLARAGYGGEVLPGEDGLTVEVHEDGLTVHRPSEV